LIILQLSENASQIHCKSVFPAAVLSFHGAGIGDALDEIRLAVQKQQQTRHHVDDGGREGDADLARVDRGEEHGERLRVRVRQEDERLFDHVPVVDKDKDGDGVERAAALRQADVPEHVPLAGAVELGRLDERDGNAAHEFCEQKHRERRECAGQDDGPAGVEDAEPVAHEIVRHERHLIGHEHQNYIGKEDAIAHPAPPPRETVGGHRGDEQLQQHDRHDEDHAVPEFEQIVGAFKEDRQILREAHLVGDELEHDLLGDVALAVRGVGEHLAVVGGELRLRHERVRDRQHGRHQKQEGEHGGQQRHGAAAEIALLFHPSTSFPNQFSTAKRMASSATMTSASSTAAAESF